MATKLSLVNEPCCQKVSMSGTTSQSNSSEGAASILLSPSQKKSEDWIAANIWNISAGFFEVIVKFFTRYFPEWTYGQHFFKHNRLFSATCLL